MAQISLEQVLKIWDRKRHYIDDNLFFFHVIFWSHFFSLNCNSSSGGLCYIFINSKSYKISHTSKNKAAQNKSPHSRQNLTSGQILTYSITWTFLIIWKGRKSNFNDESQIKLKTEIIRLFSINIWISFNDSI